jgi:uncharacterized protein DUF6867
MFDTIYETSGPNGFWVFLLVTVAIGGSAAWVTGKAIAQTWRPAWHLVVYIGLLALAVRFFHYALFWEPIVSPSNFVVDYLVLAAIAYLGHRVRRARQMSTQYLWLFERAGGLGWRARSRERKDA